MRDEANSIKADALNVPHQIIVAVEKIRVIRKNPFAQGFLEYQKKAAK